MLFAVGYQSLSEFDEVSVRTRTRDFEQALSDAVTYCQTNDPF